MGAPKQRWTSEEEAALKAGIKKYGVGKWSTILKDQDFSSALRSRSNVDLKDKWRNLNCMANGMGSRHRVKVSHKSSQATNKHGGDAAVHEMVVEKDSEEVDLTHVAESIETSYDAGSERQDSRLNDLILEAVTKLKEPRGSSQHAIARYIELRHAAPPDLERTLATNLKLLTEKGHLIKVKNQYRITPKSTSSEVGKDNFHTMLPNGTKNSLSEAENSGVIILTKARIDAELEQMKSMTAEEAAVAAARAVAEAEAAIAEAEAAAREAEEAEAEAEAARCFADAANLRGPSPIGVIHCWLRNFMALMISCKLYNIRDDNHPSMYVTLGV
ncbi:single myb histone 1-like isoform X1 [Primulina huaijiensis]|uniref:single myb histone 1-like isoform X1 n=1 Tax=Primulina huaijiensis TaxID=1492673 RepID=UPI003CC76A3E